MRRFLPTPESIRKSRWLSWLGPRLHVHERWWARRHAVARGVAIGLFFAFLLPVGQIPVAVLLAFALRANPWASAAATLVSNPFTFAPIFYAAYRIGAWVLGAGDGAAQIGLIPPEDIGLVGWVAFWWERLQQLGKPLMVGLLLLALTASAIGYFATLTAWRATVLLKRRRALRERATR